jgi:hypothetical protein
MSAIGRMACSISHDMRHSLTAIYANAEFLERHDRSASTRTDLLLEIQEAVLAMTERLDSLLQFANSGRKNRPAHERVSLIVEKAVAAVKFHPDGQNVSIIVRKFPPAEADIDARNLESAMYNLLLNACQAATRSSHAKYTRTLYADSGFASASWSALQRHGDLSRSTELDGAAGAGFHARPDGGAVGQAALGKGLLHLLTSFRWSRSEQGLNLPIGKRPPQPLRRAKLESTKPKRTPEQVHHPHAGDDVIQLVILRQTIELPRPPEEEDVAQQAGK